MKISQIREMASLELGRQYLEEQPMDAAAEVLMHKAASADMELLQIASRLPGNALCNYEQLGGTFSKEAGDMPSFTKQDRPKKVKEIYRALKREHPNMPAAMKARIAARQGKRGHQHQGPPYKGSLTKEAIGAPMFNVGGATKAPAAPALPKPPGAVAPPPAQAPTTAGTGVPQLRQPTFSAPSAPSMETGVGKMASVRKALMRAALNK